MYFELLVRCYYFPKQRGRVERMKKFVRFVLVSALALISFGSFSQTVKASGADSLLVHTLKTTRLYAKGKQVAGHDWDPQFEFSPISDRELAMNSNWYSDQRTDSDKITDGKYYRVATNEWVKLNDVVLVDNYSVIFGLYTYKNYPIFNLNTDSFKMEKADKTLPTNEWLIGSEIDFPNGDSYYQVGQNEWIQIDQ